MMLLVCLALQCLAPTLEGQTYQTGPNIPGVQKVVKRWSKRVKGLDSVSSTLCKACSHERRRLPGKTPLCETPLVSRCPRFTALHCAPLRFTALDLHLPRRFTANDFSISITSYLVKKLLSKLMCNMLVFLFLGAFNTWRMTRPASGGS